MHGSIGVCKGSQEFCGPPPGIGGSAAAPRGPSAPVPPNVPPRRFACAAENSRGRFLLLRAALADPDRGGEPVNPGFPERPGFLMAGADLLEKRVRAFEQRDDFGEFFLHDTILLKGMRQVPSKKRRRGAGNQQMRSGTARPQAARIFLSSILPGSPRQSRAPWSRAPA